MITSASRIEMSGGARVRDSGGRRQNSCDPFDPQLAEHPTISVPCTEVTDLLPLTHAPEHVARYRDLMKAGHRFPPISVIWLGRYLVADGHKRFSAYQQLGRDHLVVEVWPLRRWLRDQWRQAAGNARKNRRIVSMLFSDPVGACRLLATTLLHWQRVAASLAWRVSTFAGRNTVPTFAGLPIVAQATVVKKSRATRDRGRPLIDPSARIRG